MLQHLPPLVVERLWDMFADAAGAGFYTEYLEKEECLQIEEIPMPLLSVIAPMVVSLDTYLAGRYRTTIAEVLKAVPDISEKDLPNSLKEARWEPRRSATERLFVKI